MRETAAVISAEELETLRMLKSGDEKAFSALVSRSQGALLGLARKHLGDAGAAEEVVQETWIGFLGSLDRFEGRCSLKTWLVQILMNKAKTRAHRDRRVVPFSSLVADETSAREVAVDPSRFQLHDGPQPGHWTEPPPSWATDPEKLTEEKETLQIVREAIDALPSAQGTVMLLRDVHGQSAEEICNVLEISETNQRVLLHRARTKVRRALAARYGDGI